MSFRAIRGAISCDENSKAEMDNRTQELLRALLERNSITHNQLVSIIFTATEDLTAEFPAASARAIGLGDVPLLCARELAIDGAAKMIIRILIHCECSTPRSELHHVYLRGARSLRDDLPS